MLRVVRQVGGGQDKVNAAFPPVLLVEILSNCPCVHYPNYAYPFLQTYLKQAGVPVRWVALARTDGSTVGLHLLDLPPEDMTLLLAEVRRFGPGIVVLNQQVTPTMTSAIESCGEDIEVHVFGEDLQSVVSAEEMLAALELPLLDGVPVSFLELSPDYDSTLLNPEGMMVLPPVTVVPGAPCRYHRPIAGNPAFEGVDLNGTIQSGGCSFCVDHACRGKAILPDEAYRVALTVIERYLETSQPERHGAMFEIVDPGAFPRLLHDLVAREMPPSSFMFPRRVDEILRAEPILRETLPGLANRGHRILFTCMGLENFSVAENQRFNKGLDLRQIERVLDLLHELETAWPETLYFFREGGVNGGDTSVPVGFMMILFTPWTTLEDLSTNLQELERLGQRIPFLRKVSYQLAARLALAPGTAIAHLAAHDHLVLPRFREPVEDLNFLPSGKGQRAELPWQFKHPEVATVYRFVLRLLDRPLRQDTDPLETEATLRIGLQELREALRKRELLFLDVLSALLRAVAESGEVLRDEELLTRLRDALPIPAQAASSSSLSGAQVASESKQAASQQRPGTETVCFILEPRDPAVGHSQELSLGPATLPSMYFRKVGNWILWHGTQPLDEAGLWFLKALSSVLADERASTVSITHLPFWDALAKRIQRRSPGALVYGVRVEIRRVLR